MTTALKLLSSMAAREVLSELIKGFTAETGQAVTAQAAGGVEVAAKLREQLRHAFESIQEMEGWNAAARALRQAVLGATA